MKAIITQINALQSNLTQKVEFDILEDDDVLTSMDVTCMPSEVEINIKRLLQNFADEYAVSQSLKVGDEIS